jgi:glycosyltransferase involved in cell wall biosynthesis
MTSLQTSPRTPRVSVVVPAHNAGRYIAATVRSALDASAPDVEVLVVDDGSTDRTVAEVRAIDDPRVTVISIAASGGPSRPRNIGIRQARAPYVSLLDSDDLLKPGKLAASVAALQRCPSAGFAFNDYEKMDEDGNVFETSFSYAYPVFRQTKSEPAGDGWRLIPQRELTRALLYENFIGTSGVVIRRDLAIMLGGFDETIAFGEDSDFWFRLAHRCDALYSTRVGHSYRVHPTSLVRSNPPIRNALSRIRVLRRERARWRDREAHRQLDRRIAKNLDVIGDHHSLHRERWRAARSYLHAFALSPDKRRLVEVVRAVLLAPDDEGQNA